MTGQAVPPSAVPPPLPAAPSRDEEHLKLLSVFHYVLAGVTGLFGCLPFIHVTFGVLMLTGRLRDASGAGPPPAIGWLFLAMGSIFILVAWTEVILLIAGGRCLRRRTRRTFCLVVAGVSCLFMPLGTVLGVFTILVLSRPTARALFDTAR